MPDFGGMESANVRRFGREIDVISTLGRAVLNVNTALDVTVQKIQPVSHV